MDNPIQILITKKLSEDIISKWANPHMEINNIPFIEIRYNIVERQKVLQLLQESITVVITSQNGVNALLANFENTILAQATWKIYCIGFATQEKIKTYFTQSTIVGIAKDIHTLSDKMLLSENNKFYFFGSSIRQQHWIDKLRKHHKQVEEYWVYNTLLKSQKIDCSKYQAIVFFSPSAVDSFFLLNCVYPHVVVFVIGNTTAKAIQKYGEYNVVMPLKPTIQNLLNTIKQYFKYDVE